MAVVVDKEWLEAGLTDVSDSIRGLIESEEKLSFPQGMKEAIESYSLDEPLEAQDALIEQIKTALQGKASGGGESKSDIILGLISGIHFKNAVFPFEELELEIPNIASDNGCITFQGSSGLKKVKLIANNPNSSISIGNIFATKDSTTYNDELQVIDLSELKIGVTSYAGAFSNNRELVAVLGSLDANKLVNVSSLGNTFRGCYKLKDVRFIKETVKYNLSLLHSDLLSDDSIQSIIDGLALVEEQRTLTLHKDVKSKLTETQIATITSKNWTLA